jgi:N-acetylglucosaminylphosphatidylinositol deacetylase
MVLKIPVWIVKTISLSFVIWILLSTVLPQMIMKRSSIQIQTNQFKKASYPYSSITSPTPLPIQNSTVYFIIGHPDDEVMFFSPSLLEISKPKNNNKVKLICFSSGDSVDESIGRIRSQELFHSAKILGISKEDVTVLDFKDGMNETWDSNDIKSALGDIIGLSHSGPVALVTFDENGVSNHPNHISLYHGTLNFFRTYYKSKKQDISSVPGNSLASTNKLYVLKSLNFWEKYSFTFLTNLELFVDQLSKLIFSNLLVNVNISFFSQNLNPSIKFYSDLNMLSVSYAAMSYGHFSQMVWFRYGWLILSRYLTFNQLNEILS